MDNLKIIQIGITLSDKDGNFPKDFSTWQFNFKFDVENDICTPESINLLETAGINFNKFLQRGICPSLFAEHMISSGLVLNDNVNWVTFHGIYDLAYLLKLLTNQKLPDNEELLMEDLDLYFNNYYDIRHIIKDLHWLRGSLTKLSSYFGIQRVGSAHQAGSDIYNNQMQASNFNPPLKLNNMNYNNNNMNNFYMPQNSYYNPSAAMNSKFYSAQDNNHQFEMMNRYPSNNNNVQNEEYYFSGNIVSN